MVCNVIGIVCNSEPYTSEQSCPCIPGPLGYVGDGWYALSVNNMVRGEVIKEDMNILG